MTYIPILYRQIHSKRLNLSLHELQVIQRLLVFLLVRLVPVSLLGLVDHPGHCVHWPLDLLLDPVYHLTRLYQGDLLIHHFLAGLGSHQYRSLPVLLYYPEDHLYLGDRLCLLDRGGLLGLATHLCLLWYNVTMLENFKMFDKLLKYKWKLNSIFTSHCTSCW